jgi:hypothetical protein
MVNQTGVTWEENRALFNQGRCVLFYSVPGPIKSIVSTQKENGMSGVLNLAPLPGKKCNSGDDCPFALPEHEVNHAPFLAGGGMVYAINNRSSQEKKQAGLDFALYLSDPGVSFWDAAHPGSYFDIHRLRHTSSLANNQSKQSLAFLEFGWENRQLSKCIINSYECGDRILCTMLIFFINVGKMSFHLSRNAETDNRV